MRQLILLGSIIILLARCVNYEEEARDQNTKEASPLDSILRQLDQPREKRAASEPTQQPNGWKAHPQAGNQPDALIDAQKKLLADVYQAQIAAPWPPQLGHQFPKIPFLTAAMQKRSIEEFRGHVVLIEYVAMSSPSSQALAGANERGAFMHVPLHRNFQSLEKYFPTYSNGVNAGDVVLLQILLLDQKAKPVTADTASAWTKHFDLEARGRTVFMGSTALLQNGGDQLLGGFQLLDKNLVVRGDATGERSKTLFSELFPALSRYLRAP